MSTTATEVVPFRAIDLFCGDGGATNGLQLAGFHVTGVDNKPCPKYRGDTFIQADALEVSLTGYDFAWASSPCQEFAVHGLKMFFPNAPYPHEGIRLFKGTWARLEKSGIPYVMENVRSAQGFVGRAVNHLGPFYLWGNFVPAIFPAEFSKFKKGFGGRGIDPRTGKRITDGSRRFGSKSQKRKEFTATISMIPAPLCEFIGKQAIEYLKRQREVA